ncbi:hypothetical protein IMZ48_38660 [Candidatus Bathyarchaeota archaeon]|nr:hypothetical protein [Candidatus Bathyarchaeota archaeon]
MAAVARAKRVENWSFMVLGRCGDLMVGLESRDFDLEAGVFDVVVIIRLLMTIREIEVKNVSLIDDITTT